MKHIRFYDDDDDDAKDIYLPMTQKKRRLSCRLCEIFRGGGSESEDYQGMWS